MSKIEEAVEKAIKERGGGKSVLKMWKNLYQTYEEGGIEGLEEALNSLLESPEDDE